MRLIDRLKNMLHKRDLPEPSSVNEPSDDNDLDPFNPFPEPVTIEITDVIDLHTIPPREVRLVTAEYLYQARQLGFHSVRIIHGKGIGVQREMVRAVLAETPYVARWSDAPADAGGLGATIVEFKSSDPEVINPVGNSGEQL